MDNEVRVRFAPSPTGYLHVGGARTALFNYLFAKNKGGQFILRIEDTDVERSTDDSLRMQIEDLQWLGLVWDEGVHPDTLEDQGGFGPYRQSHRLDIYKKYGEQLVQEGKAYYDFRTDEEITDLKNAQGGEFARVPRPQIVVTGAEARRRVAAGEPAAIRFKVDHQGEYRFDDLVRGEVRLPYDMVGDFILIRSTGMPVYNFCCAIDDSLMNISHVFRAEEHLSNTLRQQMIYQALGFKAPEFGHLSLILGQDRQKLSKRHGATSCNQYRESGFLPEALVNFLALLGWSSPTGEEIMSRQQLIEQFSVARLNAAGAVFDEEKLKWMNSEYLRELPHQELWKLLQPFIKAAGLQLPSDRQWVEKALTTFKVAMVTLADIERFAPIDDHQFEVGSEAKEALSWSTTPQVIRTWQSLVSAFDKNFLSADDFARIQQQIQADCGVKGKQLFMPIRVAVIGKPHGAELQQLVPLLGKESLLKRSAKVLSLL